MIGKKKSRMGETHKILVPKQDTNHKFKEKGSVFISQIFYVDSEEAAKKILEKIRKKYFDATHNCYAYRIFPDITKYSDDGEPKGSAGVRIYNAIIHRDLFNTLLIVTRYFGGTKLGIGHLGNAYYSSACEVIENTEVVIKKLYRRIQIKSDFSYSNLIYRMLQENEAIQIKNDYKDELNISAYIPSEKLINIDSLINQYNSYQIEIEIGKENLIF